MKLRLVALLALTMTKSVYCEAYTPSASSTVATVDVSIVGGGPCGLAAALAVQRNAPSGTTVAVLERDNLEPKGASIVISKDGRQALQDIDPELKNVIEQTSVPVTSVDRQDFNGKSETGVRDTLIHSHLWHDVRTQLAERVRQVCGEDTIRSNTNLVRLHELNSDEDRTGDGCCFELDCETNETTGTTIRSKVVLAADGVGSTVRMLSPREPKAQAIFLKEERSVWRGIAPSIDCQGRATFFRSGTSSALVFPAGVQGGASWTVICPTMPGRAKDEKDAQTRALAAASAASPSTIPELLKNAIEGSSRVVEHQLAVRDFDYSYSAMTDGLTFLGDAQHPVRPTGEGLALAWGDAAELGHAIINCLKARKEESSDPTLLSVEEWIGVLRAYERAREPVVRGVSERVRTSVESFYSKKPSVV